MTRSADDIRWPLRTARLTVRPARREDLLATGAYRVLPEVNHWLPSAPETPEAYAERIGSDPAKLERTLVVLRDDTVVGDVFLSLEDDWAQAEVAEQARGSRAEVGWALDPAHQGQGYAAEAVEALLAACFEQLGVHRVVALAFAGNTPSIRLMEKLGMRRETYAVQESLHRSGAWLDSVGYALLAEEWRAQR